MNLDQEVPNSSNDFNHEQLSEWEGASEYSEDYINIKLQAKRSKGRKLEQISKSGNLTMPQQENEKTDQRKKIKSLISLEELNSCDDKEIKDKRQSEKKGSLVRL